jgi:hypothetical protein
MKGPVTDRYETTMPLLEIYFEMKIPMKVAIQLPEIFNSITGLPIENHEAFYETGTTCFPTKGMRIYIDGIFWEEFLSMGIIASDSNQFICIEKYWYLICETDIVLDWQTYRIYEEFLRFDSIDFFFTMYAEFIAMNGFKKRQSWSGLFLKPWHKVDLSAVKPLSFEPSIKLGLIRSILCNTIAFKSFFATFLFWGRSPIYRYTHKAKKSSFWRNYTMFKVTGYNS